MPRGAWRIGHPPGAGPSVRREPIGDGGREVGEPGSLEHRAHRDPHAAPAVDRGDEHHRREGVTTEREEVVLTGDP